MANALTAQALVGRCFTLLTQDGPVQVVVSSVGGGSIPAPSVSQIIFVSAVFGDDTSGDGTMNMPYATIAKAYSTISDASSTKVYNVVLFPGTYAEDVAIRPWISTFGWNPAEFFGLGYPATVNGTFTFDGSFGTTPNSVGWFSNIDIGGTVGLDYSGLGGTGGTVTFTSVQFEDAITISQNGDQATEFHGCTITADFTQFGGVVAWFETQGTDGGSLLQVGARTGSGATFNARNSSWAGDVTASQNGIADSGLVVVMNLDNSQMRSGSFTTVSAVTNVPAINAPYGAVPENVTLTGSASNHLSRQMRISTGLTFTFSDPVEPAGSLDVTAIPTPALFGATNIESLHCTITPVGANWGTLLAAANVVWSTYVVNNAGTPEVHLLLSNQGDSPLAGSSWSANFAAFLPDSV